MLSWTADGEMSSTEVHRRMPAAAGLTETELTARPGLPLRVRAPPRRVMRGRQLPFQ